MLVHFQFRLETLNVPLLRFLFSLIFLSICSRVWLGKVCIEIAAFVLLQEINCICYCYVVCTFGSTTFYLFVFRHYCRR